MCGIIGSIGDTAVVPVLLEGLSRLEYRGYDSAGLAVIQNGMLLRTRKAGKVRDLTAAVADRFCTASLGVGHTRWATHGAPTEENAHPQVDCYESIALVHNGIIENHEQLREELLGQGHRFRSETDTEVLAHLVESYFTGDLLSAVNHALKRAEGAFAVAVISTQCPDRLVAARRGSPLVVGQSPAATFLASDVPALLGRADAVAFLEDDDLVELTRDTVRIVRPDGVEIKRPFHRVTTGQTAIQKGGYKHFMLKEIHEQGRTLGETVRDASAATGLEATIRQADLAPYDHIYLVSCGTAFHASLIAEYLWEPYLGVPIQAMIASEFRMRSPHLSKKSLVIAVSQSGETMDTLMALRRARDAGAQTIALVNNESSTIAREAATAVYTRAGVEIGVAATKTFTAQVAALGLLGCCLAEARAPQDCFHGEREQLALLPSRVAESLLQEERIREISERLHHATSVLFLARGVLFPVALEGALKLKEISYIHAEGYPAGEMKHGPIALIDDKTPVVFLISRATAYAKVLSNMEEVRSRKGSIIAVTDAPEDPAILRLADDVIPVAEVEGISRPILFSLPLQMLAYHTAVLRGTDVDQPRNLAKTVTVE
jgi:glutamine---fructose-6-phosphate transaminase (isomerizing)